MNNKAFKWWQSQSIDNQIWILLKYGFENRNPANLNSSEIENLYITEHKKTN